MIPKLYIVPTPIGNLEDITYRAITVLNSVDLILAEDTRNSIHLLRHFKIEKPLRSYHAHNEHEIVQQIIEMISSNKSVALISDAGTPAISDPGYLLVRECIRNDIQVETLPGATAFVPALVNSGLPCDTFIFYGFLPQKKGRHTKLLSLKNETRTMIFYESPFRLIKLLEEFKEYLSPSRQVSVSRELSKLYEETVRGTIEELITYFKTKTVKGEIVVILAGKGND
ncbi:MAG: 16S rRNA (cytidine(1402)-2'-O)-methyltransferase [Bacteroidota bacterium]|jgi:16S rRNA (cytidine1402-2'-O)-methyltransferase